MSDKISADCPVNDFWLLGARLAQQTVWKTMREVQFLSLWVVLLTGLKTKRKTMLYTLHPVLCPSWHKALWMSATSLCLILNTRQVSKQLKPIGRHSARITCTPRIQLEGHRRSIKRAFRLCKPPVPLLQCPALEILIMLLQHNSQCYTTWGLSVCRKATGIFSSLVLIGGKHTLTLAIYSQSKPRVSVTLIDLLFCSSKTLQRKSKNRSYQPATRDWQNGWKRSTRNSREGKDAFLSIKPWGLQAGHHFGWERNRRFAGNTLPKAATTLLQPHLHILSSNLTRSVGRIINGTTVSLKSTSKMTKRHKCIGTCCWV